MRTRLLKPADLPDTLWRVGDGTVLLPTDLANSYCAMLGHLGLEELAATAMVDDGPVGGIKETDAQLHFATRFTGSSARVQLAALDPRDALDGASDLFVKAFSGGRIGLLDIPCGAGAACGAFLGCVASLRKAKVLPKEPLDVSLVAGDISDHARDYAAGLLSRMREGLEREGIWVTWNIVPWDVLDAESTTKLLHEWMKAAPDCREYFVAMANFSGFLKGKGKFSQSQPGLDEIFRWAATRRSTVIWVEPQTNAVQQNLIPRISKWFRARLPALFSTHWSPDTSIRLSDAHYQHPVRGGYRPQVRLTLIRLEANDP